MYLVSVGVECVCVKGSLVLVLVLDWTQCLPQGVGAPPAMLRGRTAGFPHKQGGRPSGEAGYVDTIGTIPPRLWRSNHTQAISVWCELTSCCCVDLPLLRVAVEGPDNPITSEQPCQASLPPDQQRYHSLGRHPKVQYVV